MKRKLSGMWVIVVMAIILLPKIQCLAASPRLPGGTTEGDGVVIVVKPMRPGNPITNRPKSPSTQEIECIYLDGSLMLSFAYSEGMCELRIYDREINHLSSYPFDSNEEGIILPIGYVKDAYLQIMTNNGNIYEGELSL